MSKQVWLMDWMVKNECAWGQKYAKLFHQYMKKWDPTFDNFWQGGTYDVNVLETQLNYTKDEYNKQICKTHNGYCGQQQQVL